MASLTGKESLLGGVHQTKQKEKQLQPPLLLQPLNASSLESTEALAASWSTPNL